MPTVSHKPILGMIGAIGAGKTAAAQQCEALGGFVIDCDQLGHVALQEADVQAELVATWGERVLGRDGHISRRAVADIVFNSPTDKDYLESVLYPKIGRMVGEKIREANHRDDVLFVVVDAAVLLEAGWKELCDKIVYIDAPVERRLQRLEARSGWDANELARREAAQWPSERRQAEADAVVLNDGPLELLQASLQNVLTNWGWPTRTDQRTDDRGTTDV